MNNFELCVIPEESIEPSQKWEQPFRQLMDEIYYPGYASTLAEENPEAYNREYFYFMELYD